MINIRKTFLAALVLLVGSPVFTYAQQESKEILKTIEKKETPNNWHQLDRAETGYYGISLNKAYDFLKGHKSHQVIVAVIDSGIDTLHEALKPVLWKNPGEIPGNGIDDDKNGYVDDVYGWNFLGGKDGRNVKEDSYEAARVYWKLKNKFGNNIPDTNALKGVEKEEAILFLKAKEKVVDEVNPAETMMLERLLPALEKGDSIIAKDLGKEEFDGNDLLNYKPVAPEARTAAAIYKSIHKMNNTNDITNKDILGSFRGDIRKATSATTPPQDFRKDIVQDNYDDINDRYYGNPDVMAGTPSHGTHVSGIIGAEKVSDNGINGIANNVRIMTLRAVPDGDEHDKDIANAIIYAVNNGAKIINMSFGKSFSPQKKWVDDAVKYAAKHDVLLIHAAGNSSQDIDINDNFPNSIFLDGAKAKNYISVGANGDPTNGGFTASFTNYGQKQVDVFAPGVNIYSSLPGGDRYGKMSGTSMAAPVVSGLAALILEYFPTLSASQIKSVIESSVTPETEKVTLPGSDGELVNLSDISKKGGTVNAYKAVKLASTMKGERKIENKTHSKDKKKKK
ncbi:MAG: S8 family serine peptidase [Ginsengibacter sp.]